MPGRKDPQASFRETMVRLRTDIAEGAKEKGIDISDACNRALAEMLGIDYRQEKLNDLPLPPPVIVAKDGALPAATGVPRQSPKVRPPVINADDPAAAGVIARSRKQTIKKTTPEVPDKKPAEPPLPPAPAKKAEPQVAEKPKKAPAKKQNRSDALKTFIAARIDRVDSGSATIPKEELFQVFSRWCREQKIATPEAKAVAVALKTKFAFLEKTVQATPCWTHVRLK